MKVHITLVGSQPAPVYHGIVATQPDKVIYIHSDSRDSQRALTPLRNVINLPEEQLPPLSPIDPQLSKVKY